MKRLLHCLIVLASIVAFLDPKLAAAANVLVGNCNQVNQNIEVSGQATLIIENDCYADDPSKSFRVRYFWVDSLSLSFLMAGYADEELQVIAGKSPRIWHGGIYPLLDDIFKRFGERPGPGSNFFYSGYSSAFLSKEGRVEDYNFRRFDELPESVRRSLRIYTGIQPILWPDIEAFREFFETPAWPSRYKMSYGTGSAINYQELSEIASRTSRADDVVANCTMIHDLVTRDEFNRFPVDVRKMADVIEGNDVLQPMEPNLSNLNKMGSPVSFRSFAAMKYFGSHNWPRDYLVRHGSYIRENCGMSAGLGISVYPREMFVLVAVVEATGRRLELDGFGYVVDRASGLRNNISATEAKREEFAFPALNRGDSIIVPLRLELRYDLDLPQFRYSRPNDVSGEYFNEIRVLNRPVVLNDGSYSPGRVISKPVSAFRPPEFDQIERTYYFGDAHDLEYVIIGGKSYEVRKTPKMARLSVGGFQEGSCPFLEFVEADGKPSLHGRILVGANHQSRSRSERIPIPEMARSIILSEREPEISHIEKIELVDASNRRILLAENIILKPWDSLQLPIPENLRQGPLSMEISGYYKPINAETLAASFGAPSHQGGAIQE